MTDKFDVEAEARKALHRWYRKQFPSACSSHELDDAYISQSIAPLLRRAMAHSAAEIRERANSAHIDEARSWYEEHGRRTMALTPFFRGAMTHVGRLLVAIDRIRALSITDEEPTTERLGDHGFAGEGDDCNVCGEGRMHYIHADDGESDD